MRLPLRKRFKGAICNFGLRYETRNVFFRHYLHYFDSHENKHDWASSKGSPSGVCTFSCQVNKFVFKNMLTLQQRFATERHISIFTYLLHIFKYSANYWWTVTLRSRVKVCGGLPHSKNGGRDVHLFALLRNRLYIVTLFANTLLEADLHRAFINHRSFREQSWRICDRMLWKHVRLGYRFCGDSVCSL